MKLSALLESAEPGILNLTDAAESSASGIVSRTVLDADQLRVTLFSFAAGQSLTEHATPARALVQILSGSCEFVLAGKASVLKAGDFVHMPPGALHAVRATEAFTMLLTLLRSSPDA